MESVSVRTADQDDLEEVVELGFGLYLTEKEFEPQLTFNRADSLNRYSSELENDDALILVAEKDNQIIGYLYSFIESLDYLTNEPMECHLEAVFIRSEERRLGTAALLLVRMEQWAREKGAQRVKASIYAGNEASRAFHEKHGFSPYNIEYLKPLD